MRLATWSDRLPPVAAVALSESQMQYPLEAFPGKMR